MKGYSTFPKALGPRCGEILRCNRCVLQLQPTRLKAEKNNNRIIVTIIITIIMIKALSSCSVVKHS